MSAETKFTEEKATYFCQQVAEGRKTLYAICAEIDIDISTLWNWMAKNGSFSQNYASAREAQADAMDARIMEVVEQVRAKDIDPNSARVMIQAMQWRAERLKPKVYGAQSQITHVREERPGDVKRLSREELLQLRQELAHPLIEGSAKAIDPKGEG